ncbi:hypothetical protein H634G_03324 [Metarhizium anisopliae BRIP 53293]|uniref:AB hydrolase-1 domain-containing protein n=1 Tax=Metarhizium anisopliae BRIP 53293 TaxID=1291518 RepID=A0A0D9P914_METAN|nr:hypothetical protein H634G_03324 [Metarhizium anisopliae BRIP 53293]KJK93783.1 hypothetical protein H633G_02286 [Metarhizium anisopliae BRIP 53284]
MKQADQRAGGNAPGFLTRLAILGIGIAPTLVPSVAASPAAFHHSRQANPANATGEFPKPDDPFHFIPCVSNQTIEGIPLLNDTNPQETWRKRFDPNPDNWKWGPAPGNATTPASSNSTQGRGLHLCGYLDVPMDYLNKSDSRIHRLAVAKYQASGLKGKGARTIVMNPGGPGGSGVDLGLNGSRHSQRLSNGVLDFLGFDPRGVGLSQPAIDCYPAALQDRWNLAAGKDLRESSSPRQQLELVNAINDAKFKACFEELGDVPRFVSTASVARDVDAIRVALGEPELTGYMVSYGTTLGQIYANMFPDKAGRLILDGVDYSREHRVTGGYASTAVHSTTDAWNEGFLGECVAAGPSDCALAKPTNGSRVTLDSVKARMAKLLDGLAERPIPAYDEEKGPVIITYSFVIGLIGGALYNPGYWPQLAQALADLESGNTTTAAFMAHREYAYQPQEPEKPLGLASELLPMVVCGDASADGPPASGLDFWESLWRNLTEKSFLTGGSNLATVFPCQNYNKYWPQGAALYQGDLNNKLKHPVLLIAETHDPVTPLRNARELHKEMGMENARLVVHHGYGHGSSPDPSDCTNAIIRGYLLNGTIPDKRETDCYANGKPYRNSTRTNNKRSLPMGGNVLMRLPL